MASSGSGIRSRPRGKIACSIALLAGGGLSSRRAGFLDCDRAQLSVAASIRFRQLADELEEYTVNIGHRVPRMKKAPEFMEPDDRRRPRAGLLEISSYPVGCFPTILGRFHTTGCNIFWTGRIVLEDFVDGKCTARDHLFTMKNSDGRCGRSRFPEPTLEGKMIDFGNATWLSAAGIAWDISGGLFLTKGLLLSDEALRRRAGTYWNLSPPAARGLCEQRIEAKAGLFQLLLGFVLQFVSAAGVVVSGGTSFIIAFPIVFVWHFYHRHFTYWVLLQTLRFVSADDPEAPWRKHFSDIDEETWRRAVKRTGVKFAEPAE